MQRTNYVGALSHDRYLTRSTALLRAASRRGAFTRAKNISKIGNSERGTVGVRIGAAAGAEVFTG